MAWLERTYGKEIVAAHVRARRLLVASLEGKKEQEMLVRLHSPGAVWRKLADVFRPKTNGARLALMQKYDSIRISLHDDPDQKRIEMEDIARDLNSIGNRIRLSEDGIPLKFVNLLPHEYHVQLQMLEERAAPPHVGR